MENYEKIWSEVLEIIKENTTPISFDTWFKEPLSINKIDNELNIVYLQVNSQRGNDFIISILKNRYISYLQFAFKSVLKDEYRVVLKSSDEYDKPVDNSVSTQKKKLIKKFWISKNSSIRSLILIILWLEAVISWHMQRHLRLRNLLPKLITLFLYMGAPDWEKHI